MRVIDTRIEDDYLSKFLIASERSRLGIFLEILSWQDMTVLRSLRTAFLRAVSGTLQRWETRGAGQVTRVEVGRLEIARQSGTHVTQLHDCIRVRVTGSKPFAHDSTPVRLLGYVVLELKPKWICG